MITLRRLFYFFGSIYFAVILIASTAGFVIAGTLLESYFQSHRFAAYFTYSNPFFKSLLWGFFINILLSSLRRWPFSPRHVPFLITHLGLLMILAGVLIKSYFGTQGHMRIIEGSGSHFLAKPNSYSLHVEKRNPNTLESLISHIPLSEDLGGHINSKTQLKGDFSELSITPINFSPHTTEKYETWIKGDRAYINGNPPFAVNEIDSFQKIPSSGEILLDGDDRLWQVIAGKTADIHKAAKRGYCQNTTVIISDTLTGEQLFRGSLEDLMQHPLNLSGKSLSFDLQFDEHQLCVAIESEKLIIPLSGEEALQNVNISSPHFGKLPFTIDLETTSSLLLLQNDSSELSLFAFNPHGQIYEETLENSAIQSVVMYDRGFGGYAMQASIPFNGHENDRRTNEAKHLALLIASLEEGQKQQKALTPPLQAFQDSCLRQQSIFSTSFVDFLSFWNSTHSWLLPVDAKLPNSIAAIVDNMDWKAIPAAHRKTCLWLNSLYSEIEPHLQQGEDILKVLEKTNWPLLPQLIALKKGPGDCSPEETEQILMALSQQLNSVADQLPEPEMNEINKGRLFTAFLQLYGIHLQHFPTKPIENSSFTTIECPLTLSCSAAEPLKKMEDNVPALSLNITNGKQSEQIQLTYDPSGQGLKWPIFSGEYLILFQPQFESIPHHVRLREGRQINHLNSNQPYSYECDLLITDRITGDLIEKTISMNHVHETKDGYRFYLSNISSPSESSAKEVQLTVNRDPAKYFLTYPGAIILCIGIFLLFWVQPYRNV